MKAAPLPWTLEECKLSDGDTAWFFQDANGKRLSFYGDEGSANVSFILNECNKWVADSANGPPIRGR